ncbi:hypothetical protein [Xenorhabdus sp. Sc-CR9]|uniref:hypothetical protein n=1 Tax=Xenorhabdus sp. Sc-CR9 TaxID=2584468 RepID=UPI001F4436EB|nr:hypothetical protein [Xenorhabdus sp. Sc-CR9]
MMESTVNVSNFIASYEIKNINCSKISALDVANSLESLVKTLSHIETMNDLNLKPYVSGMLNIAARECTTLVTLLNANEVNQ